MRPGDRALGQRLNEALIEFDQVAVQLPGIRLAGHRQAFVEQLIESIRRVKFISVLSNREHNLQRVDAASPLFDPIKAAIIRHRQGQIEEAFWLVFLSVHFGRHRRTGWRLVQLVYGALKEMPWTWERVREDPKRFRTWLDEHQSQLKLAKAYFGNHRKYTSLKAYSRDGTGAAVESYVKWIKSHGSHSTLIAEAIAKADGDKANAFELLYRSMEAVVSFGRMGKFDYLTMLGKLGLAAIEPGTVYMHGATGPKAGALLLFGRARLSDSVLNGWLAQLGKHLNVSMQVIEDALCNWQKSPDRFKPFRG